MDEADRLADLKEDNGIGFCNITKCCTEVCPVDIHITDNSIIPLKERRRRRVLRPGQMADAQDPKELVSQVWYGGASELLTVVRSTRWQPTTK